MIPWYTNVAALAGGSAPAPGSAWDATNHAAGVTLSNSNQTATGSSGDLNRIGQSTLAITDATKVWVEAKMTAVGTLAGIGLGNADEIVTAGEHIGNQNGIGILSDGRVFKFGVVAVTLSTFTTGDVLNLAVDQVNGGTIQFYKNGVSMGDALDHGCGDTVFVVFNVKGANDSVTLVQPGAFTYDAPAGFSEYGG